MWIYISYFDIPFNSPFINDALNVLPTYTSGPTAGEKKLLRHVFKQIPVDIFRGKKSSNYVKTQLIIGSADNLTGDIFTYGFANMNRISLADVGMLKVLHGGVQGIAVIRGDGVIY